MSEYLRTTRNAAQVRAGKRGWFEIKNQGDVARIDIYDEISFFGITAQDFIEELKGVSAHSIDLHLNSPGGDVFDGIAIRNALVAHDATVNVSVDGIAASIASVIATAGDRVEMAKGSMLMIHEPFALTIGDAQDMRKTAEALERMGDNIAGIYMEKAGGTAEEWRARMRDETWFNADEAVEVGLADAVAKKAAVTNQFDLSVFRNGPKPEAVEVAEEEHSTADAVDLWLERERLRVAAEELEK